MGRKGVIVFSYGCLVTWIGSNEIPFGEIADAAAVELK
jgi:hypothetical protein